MASSSKSHLAAAGSWRAPRAVPGSSHGARMATYRSPATHTVSISLSSAWHMQGKAMGQTQDGSWVDGDTCRIAVIPLSGFWWGSAPQMLLVQQPELLSDGCKAMGPEGRHQAYMNDARWPDAMAVDSLGGTGASPARAVKFKIRGFRTRSFQTVN